jgi:protein SCO1/2
MIYRTTICSFVFLSVCAALNAASIRGRVIEVLPEARSLKLEVKEGAPEGIELGATVEFRAGPGDIEIGYLGREIRAEAEYYNKNWHLEQVFPVDGLGSKAATDLNARLHDATASMSRRKFLRVGDYIPNFAMIDQRGEFVQMNQLKGKPFVLNFIFTRCTVPTMCPASTNRMASLQDIASNEMALENLQFVTITFDPEFDSPGVLREYAKGYGIASDNFYLMTSTQEVVDDLLRQFGILTMEEDGTINHTMATFLIDANGRVSFRKEGASWTTNEFMEAAREL